VSVIGPSCRLPCDGSPGCGCAAPKKIEKIGTRAAATASVAAASASVTALAAAACTACCVLPFTLPAALLAFAGGSIAVLAHLWATRLAIAAVMVAWLWIAWQWRKTQRPFARATMALMISASLLTAVATSWPWIEPTVFKTLGIVKKKAVLPNG
jgi:hypothetical protein